MKASFHTLKSWAALCASLSFIVISFSNCHSAKQVAYFQDVADTTGVIKRVTNTGFIQPIIHTGDILNIEVTTIDAEISGISQERQTGEVDGKQTITGYMVDKNGYIEVPIIGKIKVDGMTTIEIKEAVRKSALRFYKEPLVNVRIANFYITVLGEVNAPGRYIANSEKVNILDAIGLAGDLTLGGKRGNVMIIREENGESVLTRVSLNSTELFSSKYFYLQSGDKVIVEPLNAVARAGTSDQRVDRFISLSLGIVSVMVAIASVSLRFNQ